MFPSSVHWKGLKEMTPSILNDILREASFPCLVLHSIPSHFPYMTISFGFWFILI